MCGGTLATMARRESCAYLAGLDDKYVLTNVTAVAKSLNNRARSFGFRSGIRCRFRQPVVQTPTLMRVSPVGMRPRSQEQRCNATSARQLKRRVRATGGTGHICTHERDDGIYLSQRGRGQVEFKPSPAHFRGRELRSSRRNLGTGSARLKAAAVLE